MTIPRIAPGVPSGGQFAAHEHREVAIALVEPPRTIAGWERLLDEYPELVALSAAVSEHTPLYLVGGSIRDLASGMEAKDLDVTSALRPDQFREIVSGAGLDSDRSTVSVFDVGEEHGTTGVSFLRPDGTRVEVEHTTHRVESYVDGSRTPVVGFGPSLLADLDRRDFTINAVAVNVATGEVVDPHGGLDDLAGGVLRTPKDPDQTFSEDPLRISRLVRFAATRSFTCDLETGRAATRVADRLEIVSAERKRAELTRVFDAGPRATIRAMAFASYLNIRNQVFGGLGDRASVGAMQTLELTGPRDVVAALALRSTDPVGAMKDLKFTNDDIDSARRTVAAVDDIKTHDDPTAFRTAMRRHGTETLGRAARISVGFDSDFSREDKDKVLARLTENAGFDTQQRPVDGNDAMAAGLSGPRVGAALAAVDAAMCENPALSSDDAKMILRAVASGWDRQ